MAKDTFDPTTARPVAPSPSDDFDPSTAQLVPPTSIARKAGDLGLSLAKGVIGVPEAAVGLLDIPTGGAVGKFLENEGGAIGVRFKQAQDYLSSFQSDDLQAKQKQFQDADGIINKVGVALSNPSLPVNAIVESAPSIGAGGVAARGVLAAAPRIGALAAGALGEGAVSAGSAASNIRQQTEDGRLTPTQSALAAGTGLATAGFGYLGGQIAKKLGIGDLDTMIAKGSAGQAPREVAKSIPRQVIEGAISEGLLEELPQSVSEQVLQNLALNKPWHEGVDDAAVMGTLAGMAMGGGAAGVSALRAGNEPPASATAPTSTPAPAAEQSPVTGPTLALPAPEQGVIAVGADGTARTPAYQAPGYVGDVTDVQPKVIDPVREQVAAAAEQGGALSAAALTAIDTGTTAAMQPPVVEQAEPAPISLEEADARDQAAYEQFFASVDSEPVVARYFENDDDIPDFDAASNVSEADFLRSLGATDEDIQDAIATTRQSVSPQGSAAVDAGPQADEPAGPSQGAGADAAGQASQVVAAPTSLREGLAQIRTQKQQEAANAQATQEPAPATAEAPGAAAAPAVEAAGVANDFPTTQGSPNGPQADQAVQAIPQPAQAGAAPAAEPATGDAGTPATAGTPEVRALTDGAPAENTGAQAAPAEGAQVTPVAAPEFTTVKTIDGGSVTVRTADLNGDKPKLRQYTKAGKAKAVPAIHRDNLDPAGEKRAAVATEDAANPLFNVITTKSGKPFAIQSAAERELKRLAMGATHEVVRADAVQGGGRGFVIRRKESASQPEDMQPFAAETGTLGIPRAEMPQVPAQSHGALVKHLNAQGIEHETTMVEAADLKPTQAEYSPAKVAQAKEAAGDRAVIVSNDGHIIDGHHQALAAAEEGAQVKAIVLDAPVDQALEAVKNSPSAQADAVQARDTKKGPDQVPASSGLRLSRGKRAPVEANVSLSKDKARFSRSPDTKSAYDARIDALFSGDKPRLKGAKVLDRSDMLAFLGLGDGPVNLAESKVIAGQSNHPRMTAAVWKQIPEWLENPAFVFESDTVPGRLVFIAPELVNGSPVRIIVEPGAAGGVNAHLLMNAYDAQSNVFRRWETAGLLRYVDRNKYAPVSGTFQPQLTGLPGERGRARILTDKQYNGWRRANRPAFSFAGARAATADTHALVTAQDRLDAGEDPEAVRRETGWHRGADGRMRFEINDRDAAMKIGRKAIPLKSFARDLSRELDRPLRLGDVLDHPTLFAAYPALADYGVTFVPAEAMPDGARGTYSIGRIMLADDLPAREALSTLLHEIQHGIQNIEGFATGDSPERLATTMPDAKAMNDAKLLARFMATQGDTAFDARQRFTRYMGRDPNPQGVYLAERYEPEEIARMASSPLDGYKRSAGEVEARNTQARQGMTDAERRATPPNQTADVAEADVIVTFNGKVMDSAPAPANATGMTPEQAVAVLNAEQPVLTADQRNAQRRRSDERLVATLMLVDGLVEKWARAPQIIVARNMQDPQVPQIARDYDATLKSQGSDGEARGFILDGTVYLLADQLNTPRQTAEVLFHEVLGHYGLKGVFGKELTPILQQLGTMRRKDVLAKAREYGMVSKGMNDADTWAAMSAQDRLSAAEEVLAEMAQSTPEIGFVQRAIAAIRTWLRANVPGFKQLALTDAEIVRSYILPARGFVTRSSETPQQSLERALMAFSRDNDGKRAPSTTDFDTIANSVLPSNARSDTGDSQSVSSEAAIGQDPDDTRINFSRTTAAAKAVGDSLKSITVSNIKQRAGFKATDYLGLGLQALGRRQIVDIYGDMLPMTEYNRLVQQMEADKNEGGAEADQLVTRWAKLPDEGKLADLMHDATLAQIDPAKPYVEGDDKARYMSLQGRFKALSDGAQKAYIDTRDAYQSHHEKVRSAIKERIERSEIKGERKAALLKQMDDEFFKAVKGVYFPLARFGQYVVTVKGPEGKVESVSRAETMDEANSLRGSLLSAFPRDKGFTVGRVMLSKEFVAERDAVGRGFMTELYQVLDKQDMDAVQRAELEDTLGQLYLSSLPDLSWAKHGIHRKGTPGFSQDARRAYAQNMFHGARYLAKLRYSDLMQNELVAMQKHVDDWREVEGFDQPSAQRVVDEMNKRHETLMNPKSNALSTALTSFGFVFHLGLSPASAMVNLSQTALVAYPVMGAKWGYGKASAALLKASAEAAKGKNDITGSLNKDERAAYDEAVRAGTIDVTMAHDLAGIAQGEDAGVMWKIRPVMRWASFLFHHAERFNRQVTFVAAYRLAREAGTDQKAAFEQATKATYDGHFDYAAANRPRIMQGNVAKVVLLFKQYGQNMVYTLARNAQQAIKAETPEARAQARKTLGGLLATHAAAAGVLGLPMVTTLLAAASMIGGDDDEPWDAKVALQNMLADTFGQKPAEVMSRGLSRLTPWDISGRVGLDKLIFPDVQEGLEGQRLAESAMAAALGPVAGIGVNLLKGLQDMAQGQYARGLESMMPAALRGPIKSVRYEAEGVQDKTGIVVKDEVSAAGVVGQFLGFSPSEVRNATEGKSAIVQRDRALGERRQELLTKAARATMDKDAEARAEALKEIERFNEKNPGRRITAINVVQSVRNRQKRIDQAEDGVYLPRNRRDAMDAGRFANAD